MVAIFDMIRGVLKTKKYHVCISLSVLLVTVICLWNMDLQIRVRRIDEIGYWGIAAQLAGYDWKDIMSNLSYYSFGYSILLVPILWLHRLGISMAVCYQIAIIFNVIMLDATFFMALYVAERWMPKINKYYRLLCVLAITLYSNNILQSNTAWPETYIYFLYWLILVLFIKLFESSNTRGKADKIVLVAVVILSAYIFCVHMRMIAIPIAVFLVLLGYFLKNRLKQKEFGRKLLLKFGITIIAIVMLVWGCISLTETAVYRMNESANGVANTLSGTFASLVNYFSIEGIGDILLGFMGKVYYQGVASYLLSFLGIGVLIKRYIVGYFKKNEKDIAVNEVQLISALFVILSAVGSLFVSAIFMSDYFFRGIPGSVRADRVVYGRYTEFLIPVLMLVALLHLGQLRKYFDVIMGSVLCLLLAAQAVQYQWDLISFYHGDITLGIGVDGISGYFDDFQNEAYYAAFLVVGIFSIVCLLCARNRKDSIKIVKALVVIVLTIVFATKGISGTQELPKANKEKNVGSIAKLLQNISEAEIFCVDLPNTDIKLLQWELAERPIHVINSEQLSEIDIENSVIISNVSDAVIGEVSEYTDFIYSSGTITVYADRETSVGAELCNKVLDARQTVQGTVAEVNLASAVGECGHLRADGYIYSNADGEEGFVTRNTMLELPDGIYEFEIELEINNKDGESIGYILATDAQETNANVVEILPDEIGFGGKTEISINVSVQNYCEPIIGVYTYGNTDIIVKKMNCKQIVSETPRNEAERDELRRVLEIIDAEALRTNNIYYIDSDGSGIMGNPNITAGDYEQFTEEELNIYQLPTWSIKYVKNKTGNVYIMEKSGDYMKFKQFMSGFYNRYETQHFILYAEER